MGELTKKQPQLRVQQIHVYESVHGQANQKYAHKPQGVECN